MKTWLTNLFYNFDFCNSNYFFNDLLVWNNLTIFLSVIAFFISYNKPFILLLLLEIAYLGLNCQFIFIWLFTGFVDGPLYSLIILILSAAESIVGTVLILRIFKLKNINQSDAFKIK